MAEPKGYLSLILHAHLPYVRHPEHPHYLEESWFFEALTETYLPLLAIFRKLHDDGVQFRVGVSLTPTLCSMLNDDLLRYRYRRHLDSLLSLAEKEVQRTAGDPHFRPVTEYYLDTLKRIDALYRKIGGDVVGAYRELQEMGCLEILASAATHAFLPLISLSEEAVRTQVAVGVQLYQNLFGRDPQGFWLPECGFYPGLDRILKENGIRYSILDSHGILHASEWPKGSVYRPIESPAGVAFFGRDWESSKQVWSKDEGYPGDFDYRDFYRDIGFDLEYDYISPYLIDGIRGHTGLKYYRITGKTDHKEPYDRHRAIEKAAVHAGNFVFNRTKQVEFLSARMHYPPIVVAPYDAELFGHWWYEGPEWMDFVLRKVCYDTEVLASVSPSDYLDKFPPDQVAMPSGSSWGYKGYYEVWLNDTNDWIYPHLHAAADVMADLTVKYGGKNSEVQRALDQALRELLLAQSSDWPFIMKSGTMVEYAKKRVSDHVKRFFEIDRQIRTNQIDMDWLARIEQMDNLFPNLVDFGLIQCR